MKVYLAADHAGFALKQALVSFVEELGHTAEDCGAPTFDSHDDYPDVIRPCAEKVAGDSGSFGIILGASGQGEAMVANRVPGIRAAVFYGASEHTQEDATGAELGLLESARIHNDANILSLGARFISEEEAKAAVRTFLAMPFSGDERHARRINKF